MPSLPVIDLTGSPFEMGLEQGRRLAPAIAHNLSIYYDRFQREAQLSVADVRSRGRAYLAVIAEVAPAYAETVHGVSEGAAIVLDDVAALNARYEILYSQYSMINQALAAAIEPDGCTAFAVLPEASSDGHLWLGQNWDWFPAVRGAILRTRRSDGLTTAAFTEAGIVGGKIGMNSHGLGLVINGLLSDRDDWSRLRTPFHVRTWMILQQSTLDDAIEVVTGEPRACSANFLIGKANGAAEVVNIEAAPDTICRLLPERGLLAHANHFVDPGALGVSQPLAEEKSSTFQREARMSRMLEGGRAAHTLSRDHLMAMLQDHTGHPDSVCRHPNPHLREEERVETVVSVLQDLTARRLYVAAGTPCTTPFVEIPLA
ncbi:MAG TPA: C45 family peptidase [bacterium]|jgi:isopenicillin-N N-acyltransferase-like protein